MPFLINHSTLSSGYLHIVCCSLSGWSKEHFMLCTYFGLTSGCQLVHCSELAGITDKEQSFAHVG